MVINRACFKKSLTRDLNNIKNPVIIFALIISGLYFGITNIDCILSLSIPVSVTLTCITMCVISYILIRVDKQHVIKNTCLDDICEMSLGMIMLNGMMMFTCGIIENIINKSFNDGTFFYEMVMGSLILFGFIIIVTPMVRAYKLCKDETSDTVVPK